MERSKIKKIIESDRALNSNLCLQLCENDLNKLLKEYFDFDSKVKLRVVKKGDYYEVEINFNIKKIKYFSAIN